MKQEPAELFDRLMKLPSIEQATDHYERVGSEIRQALATAIPKFRNFTKDGHNDDALCGVNPDRYGFKGRTRGLPSYVSAGKLSDQSYERALKIITEIGHKYGFTDRLLRLHDSPGDHDAKLHNPMDDSEISIGTAKNTVLGINLGCHLTQEEKQLGHPKTPKTH